jgi:hypothetical protein
LFGADVCDIDKAACLALLETSREWWDQACNECGKTRVEKLPETGAWTRHILRLKFEIEECRIPYGVDDLSPEEWHCLGIVSQEMRELESRRRRRAEAEKAKAARANSW